MIQVNLIPDVKHEYLRAQKLRNSVISIAILAVAASIALVVLLGAILGGQRVTEAVTESTIKSEYKKLRETESVDNLVTIQHQLSNISSVNNKKLISSRLFDVLSAINPAPPDDIRLSTVSFDPSTSTLSLEGSGNFTSADIFTKTILNTQIEYTEDGVSGAKPLTTEVILTETSFGEDSSNTKVLRFKLNFQYAEELFRSDLTNVRIVSPTGSIDVTDSKLRVPDSLFQAPTTEKEGGE